MNRSDPKSPGVSSNQQPITIYCDGSGARPDGRGSAYAWICPANGRQHVEHVDGLTNNQAEFRAILAALSSVDRGTRVHIRSDSQLVIYQLKGRYAVRDVSLLNLRTQILRLCRERRLCVSVQWIRRSENRADALLR
jgi:ribonuclease HI